MAKLCCVGLIATYPELSSDMSFYDERRINQRFPRLKMVVEECLRDLSEEGAIQVDGYYFHNETWWQVGSDADVAPEVILELNQCSVISSPHRVRSSSFVNFPLAELRAVLRAKFNRSLRYPSQQALQRVVQRGYRNASNEHAVKYNPMTGLLAKLSFNDLVVDRLAALSAQTNLEAELSAAKSVSTALCLLALDIDHFKQVNDSYGHAYGDLVIRAFAVRVERAVSRFCSTSTTGLNAACAHVSGEEFFCLAWGAAPSSEFEALAEKILKDVRGEPLPTDEEFMLLRRAQQGLDLHNIPPSENRRVTCSIGGIVVGIPASSDTQVPASRLMHQADLALIKSKSQGRDRLTLFPSILQIGGRVLEYKSDLRVCIIDIGSEVGVSRGQEFDVFHPGFIGDSPYIYDDGRSKKILGRLPKVSLCRIAAFDVQHNISFCRISDERFEGGVIPVNSVLEAVPLGTLAMPRSMFYMVSPDDASIASVSSIAETKKKISGKVDPKVKTSFAVVGIRNESQLLAEHGSVAVNRALVVACRHLDKMSKKEFLGQIEPTKLLLQLKSFDNKDKTELDELLHKIELELGGFAKFMAGVYSTGSVESKDEKALPALVDIEARVDLARYAASQEGAMESFRVHVFTHNSASYVLWRLEKLREFKRGLADYERFTQIGIVGPELDNRAGLLAYASENWKLAESYFLKAAAQVSNDEPIYRLNAIVAQVNQGNFIEAATTFSSINIDTLDKHFKDNFYALSSICSALSNYALSTRNPVDVDRALTWLQRGLSVESVSTWHNKFRTWQNELASLVQ